MTLGKVLHREHGPEFQKVFALRGRRRTYFGQDYREMTEPREITGTGIFLERCLSANAVKARCNDLLAMFGYQPSEPEGRVPQIRIGW